ncbi:hypothetical protein LJB94_02750 [Odoribacter sp. OttesenSCG-928-G04]|nr:hypothetical protein [Odoribacter sp. OttesenSCG-928-G04]
MLKRFTVLTLLILLASNICFAQETDSIQPEVQYNIYEDLLLSDAGQGVIYLNEGLYIRELVNLHVKQNKEQKSVNGFRIQIFSGSSYDYSIERMTEIIDQFKEYFPEIPVYLNYYDPDFKIRVGNFRNRLECIPTLKMMRKKYPACYPVKTDIPFQDILDLSKEKEEEVVEEEVHPESDTLVD